MVRKAMRHSKASIARPAAGKILQDGTHPIVCESHDPSILIEKNSGANGVRNIVLIESREVNSGIQCLANNALKGRTKTNGEM